MSFAPVLVWGVFLRLLGIVYISAFASLYVDAAGWIGTRGVQPVGALLERIRKDFPSWRRLVWFPTLLWFDAGDRRQRALLGVGMLAALFVVLGVQSRSALAICWVVLLSFDIAYDMTFPWECALYEAGFLALFLPTLHTFPSVEMTAEPLPVVAWAFRFLVARVLFGFGKTKFASGSRREPAYLKSFMLAQPLPTPLGYYAYELPLFMHRAALAYMAAVELIAPVLLFLGPIPRLVGAVMIASLMVGIHLTGNYGYFNVLIFVLCIPLLDLHASLFDRALIDLQHPLITVLFGVLTFGWTMSLLVNSWVTRNWLNWPGWRAVKSGAIRAIATFYRALSPFRVVHGYGIFPPRIGPPMRFLPVIEGSHDGVHWEQFTPRRQASDPESPPKFFAPRFPRLDHWLFYEGAGVTASGLLGPLISPGHPYRYARTTTVQRIATRLLEPDSPVAAMFESRASFDEKPPAFVRVRIRSFTFPSREERAAGAWWKCADAGTIVEPLDARTAKLPLPPPPELWAWDDTVWLRRAPALDGVHRGETPAGEDVDRLWNELVPETTDAARDWSALPETVRRIRSRFSQEELDRMEIAYRGLALALGARLEPIVSPRTWYDVGMLASSIISEGRDAYERAVVSDTTFERGMLFEAIFRYETLLWHARVGRRNARAWGEPMDEPKGGIPGSVFVLPDLVERFPLAADDECAPLAFVKNEDGVWIQVATAPPAGTNTPIIARSMN